MPGRRWCVIGYLIIAILLACLCVTSCAVTSGTSDTEAETRFHQLFGSTLSNRLLLVTDKRTYRHDEMVTFWVDNRTGQTMWFHDQVFGVQAYAYDRETDEWVDVDLGFWVANPVPTTVQPGGPDILNPHSLWVEDIDVPEDGKIRLVVTGHTDLDHPDRDQAYSAYRDVQIVQ